MEISQKLILKIGNLKKAYNNLKKVPEMTYEMQIQVEVASKRFEYTYESLWKVIKLYLLEQHGLNCYSPVECFKHAFQIGLISSQDESVFYEIVRSRNELVHIYHEDKAIEIYENIVRKYIDAIGRVVEKINTL